MTTFADTLKPAPAGAARTAASTAATDRPAPSSSRVLAALPRTLPGGGPLHRPFRCGCCRCFLSPVSSSLLFPHRLVPNAVFVYLVICNRVGVNECTSAATTQHGLGGPQPRWHPRTALCWSSCCWPLRRLLSRLNRSLLLLRLSTTRNNIFRFPAATAARRCRGTLLHRRPQSEEATNRGATSNWCSPRRRSARLPARSTTESRSRGALAPL